MKQIIGSPQRSQAETTEGNLMSRTLEWHFNEYKHTRKLRAIQKQNPNTVNYLIYKQEVKPKYIIIKFFMVKREGKRNKISGEFFYWEAFFFVPPPKITFKNLIPFILFSMETMFERFRSLNSDGIHLKKIYIEFIYPFK